jgi:hypothetical protein
VTPQPAADDQFQQRRESQLGVVRAPQPTAPDHREELVFVLDPPHANPPR